MRGRREKLGRNPPSLASESHRQGGKAWTWGKQQVHSEGSSREPAVSWITPHDREGPGQMSTEPHRPYAKL